MVISLLICIIFSAVISSLIIVLYDVLTGHIVKTKYIVIAWVLVFSMITAALWPSVKECHIEKVFTVEESEIE